MRRWKKIASESNRKSDFRLTTYNILAQQYADNHKDLYSHIKHGRSNLLRWDNRWASLKSELDWLKSDIFCLQEVQSNHFHSSGNYPSIQLMANPSIYVI
jgi:mRNA deadenylase 3'-5' endonuclease subunit Ccr4